MTVCGICTDNLINQLLRGIVHDVFGADIVNGSGLAKQDEKREHHRVSSYGFACHPATSASAFIRDGGGSISEGVSRNLGASGTAGALSSSTAELSLGVMHSNSSLIKTRK